MNRIFPTEVLSGGIDYRFDDDTGRFAATTMPQALGELCVAYAAREGLIVAGFDFRVTPDDEWYCLEMNPVPTFLPYEAATGQPIGDAILNVLCGFGSDGCASHISS
jgi:glutathione synthase/RimK-type ligase-like ATP-grasp enzyme